MREKAIAVIKGAFGFTSDEDVLRMPATKPEELSSIKGLSDLLRHLTAGSADKIIAEAHEHVVASIKTKTQKTSVEEAFLRAAERIIDAPLYEAEATSMGMGSGR